MNSGLAAPAQARVARNPVVLLLAAVLFINYVDRGALPTAAHLIQADLRLSDSQLGVLLSGFFWTYATVQIPVGWLAERYGAHRVLAGGLALWAVATMLVGFSYSYLTLLILRLLLGVGESTGFPSVSKLLATVVPVEQLGTANGIVAFAYLLGPAAGAFAGGLLMAEYGWRVTFVAFGALSLLWLWPWSRQAVRDRAVSSDREPLSSFRKLLGSPGLWGTSLGHFSANYTFYFMLSWLPFYLVRERGFTTVDMAQLVGGAYLLNAVCAVAAGWSIDRFIAGGGSANRGYKSIMIAAHLGAVACMLGMAWGPRAIALVCIFVYQALCGAASPGVFAVAQILAGPRATGRWVGIQNMIGNFAGILAPALTGALVERSGHFVAAFAWAAAMSLLGVVGWVFMVPDLGARRGSAVDPV
jgi:MFS family permease